MERQQMFPSPRGEVGLKVVTEVYKGLGFSDRFRPLAGKWV